MASSRHPGRATCARGRATQQALLRAQATCSGPSFLPSGHGRVEAGGGEDAPPRRTGPVLEGFIRRRRRARPTTSTADHSGDRCCSTWRWIHAVTPRRRDLALAADHEREAARPGCTSRTWWRWRTRRAPATAVETRDSRKGRRHGALADGARRASPSPRASRRRHQGTLERRIPGSQWRTRDGRARHSLKGQELGREHGARLGWRQPMMR